MRGIILLPRYLARMSLCAVLKRVFLVGAKLTRQLTLQAVAAGRDMEITKWTEARWCQRAAFKQFSRNLWCGPNAVSLAAEIQNNAEIPPCQMSCNPLPAMVVLGIPVQQDERRSTATTMGRQINTVCPDTGLRESRKPVHAQSLVIIRCSSLPMAVETLRLRSCVCRQVERVGRTAIAIGAMAFENAGKRCAEQCEHLSRPAPCSLVSSAAAPGANQPVRASTGIYQEQVIVTPQNGPCGGFQCLAVGRDANKQIADLECGVLAAIQPAGKVLASAYCRIVHKFRSR